MSTTSDPIKEDLSDNDSMAINEVMEELLPITQQADDSREYLHQVHLENGYACATDAHVLVALPVNKNGVAKDYPAPNVHKTDSIRENGDGESLEVVCTHQNDRSGVIEPTPSEENPKEFPDVQEVYPETDEQLRVRLNAKYLKRIAEVVSDDSEDSALVISFCRIEHDEDEPDGIDSHSPVKVQGSQGVGLVMPMRLDE